ncbi:ScbA/BarX family gamma-butyrolactone biosynthesis protein [Streptomyces sp. NPDC006711]|uniref:ScbA/BarX family gamma-butyrolactone biosynthesis protein n=1 Tax=Streptomyces sp. NPDC006711 TaxID=3364762 RepID=UPI0036CC4B17
MSTSAFRPQAPVGRTSRTDDTGPPGHPLTRRPPLTATVPKEFVHRAQMADVLLTGWRRLDDTRIAVSAQLPREHRFYAPVGGTHYDPLLLAEAIRQVGALVAHAGFEVPLGQQFVMNDLTVSVLPGHLRVGDTPARLDIDVTCREVQWRGGVFTGTRYDVEIRDGAGPVAAGGAQYTCVAPKVYRRLRGERLLADAGTALHLTAPVSPQSVGRMSPVDVVLSPTARAGQWLLRVDTRHPALFDHPVDHVPGMVLIEAARQAATTLLHAAEPQRPALLPSRIASEFLRYTELDSPCLIEACPVSGGPGEDVVVVTGSQDGAQVFRCVITVPAIRP